MFYIWNKSSGRALDGIKPIMLCSACTRPSIVALGYVWRTQYTPSDDTASFAETMTIVRVCAIVSLAAISVARLMPLWGVLRQSHCCGVQYDCIQASKGHQIIAFLANCLASYSVSVTACTSCSMKNWRVLQQQQQQQRRRDVQGVRR